MINELLLRLSLVVYGFNEFSGPPWNTSFPCPTAILVRPHRNSDCIEKPSGAYCRFPNMTLAHSTLSSCPEVDTLDVWLEPATCTGVERDRSDFPFLEGEEYPPLRSLKLDGYSFGGLLVSPDEKEIERYCVGPVGEDDFWDEADDWVELQNNKLKMSWEKEGGRQKTNLDMWLQAMDWSRLEELSINTGRSEMFDAIAELPMRLTSLKTLHIDSLPFIEKLRNHSLETLRWVGPTQPGHLDTILSRQGQSLTHLEYRCDELDCPTWPTHTNITDLALSAPALQHLSINLPRNPNGTWPLNHLSALSRMPSLTTADLYFQLQAPCEAQRYLLGTRINCGRAYRQLERCSGPDSFAAPYLNATTALHMFRWLRTEGTSQRLAAVTFRTGDWTVGRQTWWSQPFVSDRRSAVHCRVEGEREVCEAQNEGYWQRYFGRDLAWDGETWVVDDDLEDFEEAEYQGDVGWIDSLREKMKKRIEAFDR